MVQTLLDLSNLEAAYLDGKASFEAAPKHFGRMWESEALRQAFSLYCFYVYGDFSVYKDKFIDGFMDAWEKYRLQNPK